MVRGAVGACEQLGWVSEGVPAVRTLQSVRVAFGSTEIVQGGVISARMRRCGVSRCASSGRRARRGRAARTSRYTSGGRHTSSRTSPLSVSGPAPCGTTQVSPLRTCVVPSSQPSSPAPASITRTANPAGAS